MKLLTCTSEGQGIRKNDFSFTEEGELAVFGMDCLEGVDDNCGCRRSMSGIGSFKGTTTMKVSEIDITHEEFERRISESMVKSGWGVPSPRRLRNIAMELEEAGRTWPTGTIVERRESLQKRTMPRRTQTVPTTPEEPAMVMAGRRRVLMTKGLQ